MNDIRGKLHRFNLLLAGHRITMENISGNQAPISAYIQRNLEEKACALVFTDLEQTRAPGLKIFRIRKYRMMDCKTRSLLEYSLPEYSIYESIGWPDDGLRDKAEAGDDFLTKAPFLQAGPTSAERGHFSSISISNAEESGKPLFKRAQCPT